MKRSNRIVQAAMPLLLASLLVPSAAQAVEINRYLIQGKSGSDVSELQRFLIGESHLNISRPTGYFGPLTASAVASWQKTQGITPTGTVGPITRARLSGSRSSGSNAESVATVQVPAGFASTLAALISTSTASTTALASSGGGSIGGAVTANGSIITPSGYVYAASPSLSASRSRRSGPTTHAEVAYISVVSTTPADEATGAYQNRGIKIVFSDAMDANTINSTTISVTADDSPVAGTVSYFPSAKTAVFSPSAAFSANASVEVTVSKDVKNGSGIGLADDYVFGFTVGSSLAPNSSIDLGAAKSHGILALGLSNSSPLTVKGSLGTGSGGQAANPSVNNGTNDANNAAYASANSAFETAYLESSYRACDSTQTGSYDIGNRTYSPGVYCFSGPVTLTGTTTLDGTGTYVFKFNDSFTVATSGTTWFTNGAQPTQAFWVANSTTNLGSQSAIHGNVFANGAASVNANTTFDGRLFSRATVTTAATTTVNVPADRYCTLIPKYNRTASYITNGTTTVTGEIDGTFCDYAVYIGPNDHVTVANATVHDSYRAGIFNDGGYSYISTTTVYQIGDHTDTGGWHFNGTQTGLGISILTGSTGAVIGNTVHDYQKAGIRSEAIGPNFLIQNNVVTGVGSTTVTAQIGIQLGNPPVLTAANVGYFTGNVVSGNIYTPVWGASAGILADSVSGEDVHYLIDTINANNTVTGYGNPVPVIDYTGNDVSDIAVGTF